VPSSPHLTEIVANTPVALFGHSRRQLFANAAIAVSRDAAKPCVGQR